MDDKNDLLVIGGLIGVALIAYVVLSQSQTNSSGIVFGQADPQSVAALYSANASDVASEEQSKTAIATAQIGSRTSIASDYYNYLGLTNTNSSSVQEATIGANSADAIARAQYASATQIAQTNASAQTQIAGYAASAAMGVAGSQAAAAEAASASNTTIGVAAANEAGTAAIANANAAKTVGSEQTTGNIFSSIFKAIGAIFG